jgi:2'-5' RNA ligase
MKGERIRAFLAVELSDAAREQARTAIRGLAQLDPPRVRWTPPESLHLTVKFLGGIDPEAVPVLLRHAAARLARLEGFPVALGGVGAFPNARRARVLWLGVTQGVSDLARLARKLDAAASRIGVERERRPYRGHLTLGRLREPAPVPLERVHAEPGETFAVSEVVLFESRLSPAGATYVPLARLPLGQAEVAEIEFAPQA